MTEKPRPQMTDGQEAVYLDLLAQWKRQHPGLTSLEKQDELKDQARTTPIDFSKDQAAEYWNTINEWKKGGKEPNAEDLKSIAADVRGWKK